MVMAIGRRRQRFPGFRSTRHTSNASSFDATSTRCDRRGAGGSPRRWQRAVMNRAVNEYIASLEPPRRAAVEISGEAHASKPWKEYTALMYPDFDLCAPLEERRRFDVVIC